MRLLPGERLEAELSPHPLAWGGRYGVAAFPGLLGLVLATTFRAPWWRGASDGAWYELWRLLYGNTAAAYLYMFFALGLIGTAVSVATVRWRVFFGYLGIGALTALAAWRLDAAAEQVIPVGLVVLGAPWLWMAELDRRSHKYALTNLRVLFRGGVVVRQERQLRYETITDLDGTQGILGRMLDHGTLILVIQSAFGPGADTGQAGIPAAGGAGPGAIPGGGAAFASGGREGHAGRARTFHQLTGIRPYKQTRHLLERLVQEATTTPYLREQVALQRQMMAQ